MSPGTRTALVALTAAAGVVLPAACTTSIDDLGYAVTERKGAQELIVDLCGSDPPDRLIVARVSTGGITPDQLAEPAPDAVLFEVDGSEWTSERRTFALRDQADAPPPMQEFAIYTTSSNALGSADGTHSLPSGPWPEHPRALTSASDFTHPVRLDTDRGDLCTPS